MLDLKGDLMLSQQLLRHEDIRTTRGYLRGSQERLRAAQAELEASWAN
jgi:site-specific recombinase XerD